MPDRTQPRGKSAEPPKMTPDEFRSIMAALYVRPGWKARNLDAGNGRVYDLVDWRDKRAMVDVDWEYQRVAGYLGEDKLIELEAYTPGLAQGVMEIVENELMRRENERKEQEA